MKDLYPFLQEDAGSDPAAVAAVLADARESTLRKCEDVVAIRRRLRDEYAVQLEAAARAMQQRWAHGGTLLAFGNGGSATDAQDAVRDCLDRSLPALDLTADAAVLTAIANDVGFTKVFRRQLIAYGQSGDIVLAFSTSGNSKNLLEGLEEAKSRGILTLAVSGGLDGGAIARPGVADFCFVARSEYIPRIQEAQATLWHVLLDLAS